MGCGFSDLKALKSYHLLVPRLPLPSHSSQGLLHPFYSPEYPKPWLLSPNPRSFRSFGNFSPAAHTVPSEVLFQQALVVCGVGWGCLLSRSAQRELEAWGCGSRLWGQYLSTSHPQAQASLAADYFILSISIVPTSQSLGREVCEVASIMQQGQGMGTKSSIG